MTCFLCRGTEYDGYSTFTTEVDNCIIIVKNVPSYICSQCGEVSYSDEVALRLEQIVKSLTSPVSAEIAVVSYSVQAA